MKPQQELTAEDFTVLRPVLIVNPDSAYHGDTGLVGRVHIDPRGNATIFVVGPAARPLPFGITELEVLS